MALKALPRSSKLYRFEHVPTYLQSNPYLRDGYRAYLSKSECIASMFTWNNEIINIWSHLLGLILFSGFFVHDLLVVAPAYKLSVGDTCNMLLFVLCIMFMLGCSTAYHTFSCHSEDTYRKFLKWDIDGVTVSVIGIYIFGIHTIFACHRDWRLLYYIVVGVMSFMILAFHFKTKQKSSKDHQRMSTILASWVGMGILIALHGAYLHGLGSPFTNSILVQTAVYYMLIGSGFFFYLTKYPEKCCPGKVDCFGASHQLWHVLILLGITWWHQCCVWNLRYKYLNGCN